MITFTFKKLLPNSKVPCFPSEETTSQTFKNEWLKEGYNVGLMLKHFVLIDIDCYKYKSDGKKEKQKVISILGEPNIIQKTSQQGYHLLYIKDPNKKFDTVRFKNKIKNKQITKNIDIRDSENSFCVYAGSKGKNGASYILEKENLEISNKINEFLVDISLLEKQRELFTNKLYKTDNVFYFENLNIEVPKRRGFDKRTKKRHMQAWHHACIISDKLKSKYPNVDENILLNFGSLILLDEIEENKFVFSKISNHKDKGWNWTYQTFFKAFYRTKKKSNNPKYYNKWKASRYHLLFTENWSVQELAALDTILARAKEFNSTIFWMSARDFKEACPTADYSLLQSLIDKKVISIREKGNIWTGKASIYVLQACPYNKSADIPFSFNDSLWASQSLSIAKTLAYIQKNINISQLQQELQISQSTAYLHCKKLLELNLIKQTENNFFQYNTDNTSLACNTEEPILQERAQKHKKERELFKEFQNYIFEKTLNCLYKIKTTKNFGKRKFYKNKKIHTLSISTYLHTHPPFLRRALKETKSIKIDENYCYINYSKLESLLILS